MRAMRTAAVCLTIFLAQTTCAAAQKLALVIGNSSYANVPALENPLADARMMADTFSDLGFEVIEGYDLDQSEFADILFRFSEELEDAEIAAFYFAGHGIQFNGKNYLISTDAQLANPFAFQSETMGLELIIDTMKSNVPLSLIFLDACRDNPFVTRLQMQSADSLSAGLASVETGSSETIVMYAAAPNSVALDGNTGHSPFASALARHLPVADTELGLLMKRVIRDVRDATDGFQSPELLMAASAEVYLRMTDDMLSRGAITSISEDENLSDADVQRQIEELWNGGFLLTREGLDSAAYVLFDSAQKLAEAHFGDDSLVYGQANNHLIGALSSLDRIEDAIYAAREAIRVGIIHNGKESISVTNDRANLASRLMVVGDHAAAQSEFDEAIRVFEAASATASDFVGFASALDGYSQLLAEQGKMSEAIETARRALETYEVSGLTSQINYGWTLSNVAYMERRTGNCEQSTRLFRRAVDAFVAAGVSPEQSDHANSIRMAQEAC